MQAIAIDSDALRALAASRGIDTVRELADRSGISEWVLYKALRNERMKPSHVLTLTDLLGASSNGGPASFVREPEAEATS